MRITSLWAPVALAAVAAAGWVPAAAESDAAAPAAAPEEPTPAYAPGDVVATVNGVEVTLAEVVAVFAALPDQYKALPDEALWTGILTQIVDETILAQAGEAAGMAERRDVRLTLKVQRRNALANVYLNQRIGEAVDEARIEAEYRARYVDVEPVVEIRASHILLKEEAEAARLREEILAGLDFAEAARENSTGPTGPNGGDLGWFQAGQMVPEFSEAAFALTVGEVSEPVQSPFGWHLIKVFERRDKPAPSLEEVRASLTEELSAEVASEQVAALKSRAEIVFAEDRRIEGLRDVGILGLE